MNVSRHLSARSEPSLARYEFVSLSLGARITLSACSSIHNRYKIKDTCQASIDPRSPFFLLVSRSVGLWSVGWLVGWSVGRLVFQSLFPKKGGEFHFHAPIGALVIASSLLSHSFTSFL